MDRNFQSGRFFMGLTDVFPFQTQPSVCVSAGGQGYRFRLDSPKEYADLKTFPVLGDRNISEQDWVVLWDFTRLEAHSATGVVWRLAASHGMAFQSPKSAETALWDLGGMRLMKQKSSSELAYLPENILADRRMCRTSETNAISQLAKYRHYTNYCRQGSPFPSSW